MLKKIIPTLFSFALFTTGCGPSLAEYVAQSSNYYSSSVTKTSISVQIEGKKVAPEGLGTIGSVGAAVNIASSVGAAAVSFDQKKRLQNVITSAEINSLVASGFNDGFENATHLAIVDNSKNPDLRIMLHVNNYGLWAKSILDPINFFVDCEIQVIHTASMKKIYSNSVFIHREALNLLSQISNELDANVSSSWALKMAGIKTAYAVAGSSSLLRGAANLMAFFELSDEQIKTVFDYMAYEAGGEVARQFIQEIYD